MPLNSIRVANTVDLDPRINPLILASPNHIAAWEDPNGTKADVSRVPSLTVRVCSKRDRSLRDAKVSS